MTLSMKSWAVIVLAALVVCVFAVTLAVLLTPGVSLADMLEWLTHTLPCGGSSS